MVSQKENSGTNKARKNIRAEKTQHPWKIHRWAAEKRDKMIKNVLDYIK